MRIVVSLKSKFTVWVIAFVLVTINVSLNAQTASKRVEKPAVVLDVVEDGEAAVEFLGYHKGAIASPQDSLRKKLVKIPSLPIIPKKVLTVEDSIARINYHNTRHVFTPSAFSLPKGAVYYQNYNALINDINWGITNELSLGIGYAFPLFAYLTPKYSMPIKKNHTVAVGDIAAYSVFTGSANRMWLNTLYGMYTLGSTQNNVSLGIGLLQSSESDGNLTVTNLSGMYSITPNFYVVGEAWFNNRNRTFISSYNNFIYNDVKMQYDAVTVPVKEDLKRSTLFTSVQFRIIGQKQRTTAWSFGISSYWEHGDRFKYDAMVSVLDETTGQSTFENQSLVMGPANRFYFIPSFTYAKKIGNRKSGLR